MINTGSLIFIGQAEGLSKGLETGKGVFDDFFGGISNSMAPMLGEFLPKLLGALVILVVGYILARIIKWVITNVISRTGVGEKLGPYLGSSSGSGSDLAGGFGTGAFWVTMMFVAIACLRALDLDSVSQPLMELLNKFFAFVPNLIGAGILFAVAWLVATVAKFGTARALEAGDVDNRLKLEQGTLTNTIPMAAFSFILLFFLPGVLDALKIESLSGPVKDMVKQILDFMPNLLSAGIILAIFFFIAKLASTLVANLLTGVGFNNMPQKLGLVSNETPMSMQPADMAGKAAFGVIALMGLSQAVSSLKLEMLSNFVNEAWGFAIPIIIGVAILAVGLWLGNMARKAILASNMANSDTMASVAFGGIMVLTGVIALKRMGLAGEIVDMGFGLALGGVALALALAFGLGGRDAAAKFLDKRVK